MLPPIEIGQMRISPVNVIDVENIDVMETRADEPTDPTLL